MEYELRLIKTMTRSPRLIANTARIAKLKRVARSAERGRPAIAAIRTTGATQYIPNGNVTMCDKLYGICAVSDPDEATISTRTASVAAALSVQRTGIISLKILA